MVQSKGVVEYQKLGDKEISVRALHLLIEQLSGDTIVSINKDKPLITVTTKKGTVKIAYNDSQNISQELVVDEGKRLSFDDETREISLK